MARITKERKSIALTPAEQKNAAIIDFNPKGVDLGFDKFNIPEQVVSQCNDEINAVIQKHLARLNPLAETVDAANGDGYFARLQGLHKVKVSLWSAKMQSRAARLQAVAEGKVPAEVFEKDEVEQSVGAEDTGIEIG